MRGNDNDDRYVKFSILFNNNGIWTHEQYNFSNLTIINNETLNDTQKINLPNSREIPSIALSSDSSQLAMLCKIRDTYYILA
jgi:hypothetical protein